MPSRRKATPKRRTPSRTKVPASKRLPPRAKAARKRRFVERPDIRATLLEAAEALVREEGYAAATARAIANRVGLKHQVVFYYFGTQDDLLLALFRRAAESHRQRLQLALTSEEPLRAMWDVISDPHATRLALEFMVAANHNDAMRTEIARNAQAVRALETEAVARHLAQRGIRPRLSPQLVSILTNALARLLVQEATLGIHAGHEEAHTLVDASFSNFYARGDTTPGLAPLVEAMSSTEDLQRR